MRTLVCVLLGLLLAWMLLSFSGNLFNAQGELFRIHNSNEISGLTPIASYLITFIIAVLISVVGYFSTANCERSWCKMLHKVFALALFLCGLVMAFYFSLVGASFGARIVGVRNEGWGLQFLPAIYGGSLVGVVGYCMAFPIIWNRRGEIFSTAIIASLCVSVVAMFLSACFYFIVGLG